MRDIAPTCLVIVKTEGFVNCRVLHPYLMFWWLLSWGHRERNRNFEVHSCSPASTDQDAFFRCFPPPGVRRAWAGERKGWSPVFKVYYSWELPDVVSDFLESSHPREVAMAGLYEARSILPGQRPCNLCYFGGWGSERAPGWHLVRVCLAPELALILSAAVFSTPTSQQPYEVGAVTAPILQARKSTLWNVKYFAQAHPAWV